MELGVIESKLCVKDILRMSLFFVALPKVGLLVSRRNWGLLDICCPNVQEMVTKKV
jgi:hypothetical protein